MPHLSEIAFSVDPGEVSEVFETPLGFHILRVEEKKVEDGEEQVHIGHILLRVEASNRTLRATTRNAGDFLDEIAEGKSFQKTAASMGFTVETTPPFSRGGAVPGIGLLRSVHRFAFSSPAGTVLNGAPPGLGPG